jgi:lipopolysaccharide transport system ATP-binding protein
VIKSGVVLAPNIHVNNGEGVCVFISHDWAPEWRRQPRPVGRYRSTCTIPGNLLSEGTFIIGASIGTYRPFIVRALVKDVIAFEVRDTADGDSARGDYAGRLPGVVRPLLPWTTTVQAASSVDA